MKELIEFIAIILIFGLIPAIIVFIFYTINKNRHIEKLSLIEKGLDIYASQKGINPLQRVLMWALLLIGVGHGLFVGYILSLVTAFEEDKIVPIMAVLFGGIGLIVYYIYRKRTETRETD